MPENKHKPLILNRNNSKMKLPGSLTKCYGAFWAEVKRGRREMNEFFSHTHSQLLLLEELTKAEKLDKALEKAELSLKKAQQSNNVSDKAVLRKESSVALLELQSLCMKKMNSSAWKTHQNLIVSLPAYEEFRSALESWRGNYDNFNSSAEIADEKQYCMGLLNDLISKGDAAILCATMTLPATPAPVMYMSLPGR